MGQTAFLSVVKDKDKFHWLECKQSKQVAHSLSEAALHVYQAFGKAWRTKVALCREARELQRREAAEQNTVALARDTEWPLSLPDVEGLRYMHAHVLHSDHSRRLKSGHTS